MNDNIDTKIIKNYEMIKKVGKGAYGQVWKCINKKTHTTCALKRIFDAFRNSIDCQRTYRQIMYLKSLKHQNIVKLISYQKSHNQKDMYIQMQYIESDLSTALKNQYLKDIQKQYIFTQIVSAIYYLHSGNLIHRDIKPSNILVGANCQAKICDFGLIRSILYGQETHQGKSKNGLSTILTDNIATRWYKAPELLLSSANYGKQIDIWSLGCLLGQLYLQKPLFQGISSYNQLQQIIQVTGIPNLDSISQIISSETSRTILKSMQEKLDQQKPSIKKQSNTSASITSNTTIKSKSTSSLQQFDQPQLQFSQSQYTHSSTKLLQLIPSLQIHNLQQSNQTIKTKQLIIDLLSKILQFNPKKRLTIQQIIQHPYLHKFKNKIQFKKIQQPILIKYDSIKLDIDDYKLLLNSNTNQCIQINLNKYQSSKSKTKSKQKSIKKNRDQHSPKFIPTQTTPNDRTTSNTKPTPLPPPQSTTTTNLPSKKTYSNCSGHSNCQSTSKKPNKQQQQKYHPNNIPKSPTNSCNYRVTHLKDSTDSNCNKYIQSIPYTNPNNPITPSLNPNQVTTYYNITNSTNINTTYIHTNYLQSTNQPPSHQHYNTFILPQDQTTSPRSSTYINYNINIGSSLMCNSTTSHHLLQDTQSIISHASTNQINQQNHTNHCNCQNNNQHNAENCCNHSEKSVSVNKSDNKSISAMSCKSYKSNMSNLSHISNISNITKYNSKNIINNSKSKPPPNQPPAYKNNIPLTPTILSTIGQINPRIPTNNSNKNYKYDTIKTPTNTNSITKQMKKIDKVPASKQPLKDKTINKTKIQVTSKDTKTVINNPTQQINQSKKKVVYNQYICTKIKSKCGTNLIRKDTNQTIQSVTSNNNNNLINNNNNINNNLNNNNNNNLINNSNNNSNNNNINNNNNNNNNNITNNINNNNNNNNNNNINNNINNNNNNNINNNINNNNNNNNNNNINNINNNNINNDENIKTTKQKTINQQHQQPIQNTANVASKIKNDKQKQQANTISQKQNPQNLNISLNTQSQQQQKQITNNQSIRTQSQSNSSITNMHESKVHSQGYTKTDQLTTISFEQKNTITSITVHSKQQPNSTLKQLQSVYPYSHPTSQPPKQNLKLNASTGLNTNTNNQHITTQTYHYMPMQKQYPSNSAHFGMNNNCQNNKINYLHNGHHNTQNQLQNPNISPFTIKTTNTHQIPQHLYTRIQQNVYKPKPPQFRKL